MKKLLIVVDMQNDFINGSLGTKEAERIVLRVADKMKRHKGMIVCTRDTHTENYLNTQEGKNLPVVHCIKDTEGWQLALSVQQIVEKRELMVLNKPGFASPELADYTLSLYESGHIEKIELVGLCTDICVISNAIFLKTAIPEMVITVDATCCAGVTPESHKNALEAMKMCQIIIENK